ncbi:MAG: peptidoglycan-binding protein [Clostridia bacterium]|nr:peptidoglycan-binding protein [Clostridia bacterium]
MKYNMYNNRQNVLEAEYFLRANHRLEGGTLINADGIFDSDATDAVLLFQRQNGLDRTGIIDYTTWVLLEENARAICNETGCLIELNNSHNF